jgi:hypothetical protein
MTGSKRNREDSRRYGERKAIVEAEDWEGPDFQTCANAASVCRSFETSRRRELLSFRHHAEVAALPPDEADALLDWCAETPKPFETGLYWVSIPKVKTKHPPFDNILSCTNEANFIGLPRKPALFHFNDHHICRHESAAAWRALIICVQLVLAVAVWPTFDRPKRLGEVERWPCGRGNLARIFIL